MRRIVCALMIVALAAPVGGPRAAEKIRVVATIPDLDFLSGIAFDVTGAFGFHRPFSALNARYGSNASNGSGRPGS